MLPTAPTASCSRGTRDELSSAGFWPGGGAEGAYYSYAYPAPEGFADAPVPEGAYFSEELRRVPPAVRDRPALRRPGCARAGVPPRDVSRRRRPGALGRTRRPAWIPRRRGEQPGCGSGRPAAGAPRRGRLRRSTRGSSAGVLQRAADRALRAGVRARHHGERVEQPRIPLPDDSLQRARRVRIPGIDPVRAGIPGRHHPGDRDPGHLHVRAPGADVARGCGGARVHPADPPLLRDAAARGRGVLPDACRKGPNELLEIGQRGYRRGVFFTISSAIAIVNSMVAGVGVSLLLHTAVRSLPVVIAAGVARRSCSSCCTAPTRRSRYGRQRRLLVSPDAPDA